jgi:hypothetical protein
MIIVGGAMATGSYILGSEVKIPIQFTIDGVPHPDIIPVVEKIFNPNGTLASGFPVTASALDYNSSMYYISFTPTMVGDYIVLIKTTHEGSDYYTHDNFTVSNGIKSAPRAEPK